MWLTTIPRRLLQVLNGRIMFVGHFFSCKTTAFLLACVCCISPHMCQENTFCDINFIGRLGSGVILSPNYPFDYKNNLHCRYTFYFDPGASSFGRQVCFTFHRFSLEYEEDCRNDYLEFENAAGDKMRYCGKGDLAGSKRQADRTNVFSSDFCWPAASSSMVVVFFSSAWINSTGFYATYDIITHDPYRIQDEHPDLTNSLLKTPNGAPCNDAQYTCFNRKCIPQSTKCDGIDNCGDGSDEDFTHARCPGQQNISACDLESTYALDEYCRFRAINWKRDNTSPSGPRFDHTLGDLFAGHFAYSWYLNSNMANFWYDDLPIQATGHHCFSMWYFMSGHVGTLKVNMSTNVDEQSRTVWSRSGNQGTRVQWQRAELDLTGDLFPIYELVIFSTDETIEDEIPAFANIAVDDISLMPGKCMGSDLSCNFELGLCGWINDVNADLLWKRALPSKDIPDDRNVFIDHEFHIFMDVRGADIGDNARFISRAVNLGPSRSRCFSFWYYISGNSTHSLKVNIIDYTGWEKTLWSSPDNLGSQWSKEQVALVSSEIEGPFQIILEATFGYTDHAVLTYVGIDELDLNQDYCSVTTTARPTGPTPPTTCPPERPFRCGSGHCILQIWVCDGKFDCPDQSEEVGCGKRAIHLSAGTVIGICCGGVFLLSVVIIVTIYLIRRRNRERRQGPNPSPPYIPPDLYWPSNIPEEPTVVPNEENVLDPPPPYYPPEGAQSIDASNVYAVQSYMPLPTAMPPPYSIEDSPALTISIFPDQQNPPPSYEIAIYPRSRNCSNHSTQGTENVRAPDVTPGPSHSIRRNISANDRQLPPRAGRGAQKQVPRSRLRQSHRRQDNRRPTTDLARALQNLPIRAPDSNKMRTETSGQSQSEGSQTREGNPAAGGSFPSQPRDTQTRRSPDHGYQLRVDAHRSVRPRPLILHDREPSGNRRQTSDSLDKPETTI